MSFVSRRPPGRQPPWRFSAQAVILTAAVATLIAAITFAVLGGLQPRDNGRYGRGRTDVEQLRARLDQLSIELAAARANVSSETESVGFSAYKAVPQSVGAGFASVMGWSVNAGSPAYDLTLGGFNNATGVFTASLAAKYQIDASICWAAGASGSRIAVILNSASAAMHAFSFIFYAGVGDVCNVMTVIYDLEPGDNFFLLVVHTSPGFQTISTSTTFSVERIAS